MNNCLKLKCSYCNYFTNRKFNLNRHEISKHSLEILNNIKNDNSIGKVNDLEEKVNVSEEKVNDLQEKVNNDKNICYKCNTKGHFAKDCDIDSFNVQEYINKFNTHIELTDEINRLELIYGNIIQIQKNIDMTNKYNIKCLSSVSN